jgi:hypothetical protein
LWDAHRLVERLQKHINGLQAPQSLEQNPFDLMGYETGYNFNMNRIGKSKFPSRLKTGGVQQKNLKILNSPIFRSVCKKKQKEFDEL